MSFFQSHFHHISRKMEKKILCARAATISAMCVMAILKKKQKAKKDKRIWVKPWISRRDKKGIKQNLLKELQAEDQKYYKKYLRMDDDTFKYIVIKISPYIKRQDTHLRNAISVEDRLILTLRFLATGESYASLQFSTRIPQCTISGIVPETCEAIYRALKDEFLKIPSTQQEWKSVAKEYQEKWNVFNAIGAMDGKHIRIQCPPAGGAHFFNYKGFNSIILFALADANYKFIYVDVGTNGRVGDAGVFAKSKLRQCLINPSILNIPPENELTNNISTPYVVLADDAFPLAYNVMKPYPLRDISREESIFNYRLSRGRRIIESSFGIMAARFRVFLITINLSPEKVKSLTLACCTLHNMLIEKQKHMYTQTESFMVKDRDYEFLNMRPLEETAVMQVLGRQNLNTGNKRVGKEVRDTFKTLLQWAWEGSVAG